MRWRRMVGIGLVIAVAFVSGLLIGGHGATGTARAQTTGAQPAAPIQEYPLPNGVLCYTLTTGNGGFSCVYSPGLSPAAPHS
ncbi:MAG TPA: hypothetical protein VK066_25455 [Chloroflexota bacterium]|nr:hypothetical protein [Chloroflexota bacterium]